VLGVLAGVLLRDLAWFAATERGWPTQALVIDWERVEQLLNGNPADINRASLQTENASTPTGIQEKGS
jgi:hypothetical protein